MKSTAILKTVIPAVAVKLARILLDWANLQAVKVEVTEHGDHYDPIEKAVRLTPDKFNGKSLTAITVATHEVGHARYKTGMVICH